MVTDTKPTAAMRPARRSKAFRRGLGVLSCAVWLTVCASAQAEWTVVETQPPSSDDTVETAAVTNEQGYSFRIFLLDRKEVRGLLELPPRFHRYAKDGCPTIMIDNHPPIALKSGDRPCIAEARKAWFTLGVVKEEQIPSKQLSQLMNGSRLLFRVRLNNTGYAETVFSLEKSKQAVKAALSQLQVVEE